MNSWNWLEEGVVIAVHAEQIAEHGGSNGLRDRGLLSSALARPQNLVGYGTPTVFDLAAAYAYGIVQNHPFINGNKRTGFLAAYVFLALNGWKLIASEASAVEAVLALASGGIGEAEFAGWIKAQSIRRITN